MTSDLVTGDCGVPKPMGPFDGNIDVSDNEMRGGFLSEEKVRLGVMLLHTRGYVILRNALPVSLVDDLRSSFAPIFADNVAKHAEGKAEVHRESGNSVYWERGSRFRIFPKLSGPFGSRFVVRNPFADRIITETLGDYYCKFVSSDTVLKGSQTQAPHRDIPFYDRRDSFGCIVNIPIMHIGLHNGPTEVWPGGSHLWRSDTFLRYNVRPFVQDGVNPAVESLVSHLASTKIELHPGELLIRDPGMWHRGTPNSCEEPRTMLTSGYFRRNYYYKYGDPLYNLDAELFSELDTDVQRLFAPFFDRSHPLFWKHRSTQTLERATSRPYSGAPLRAVIRTAHRTKLVARTRRWNRD